MKQERRTQLSDLYSKMLQSYIESSIYNLLGRINIIRRFAGITGQAPWRQLLAELAEDSQSGRSVLSFRRKKVLPPDCAD